jgi:hypothetical protein
MGAATTDACVLYTGRGANSTGVHTPREFVRLMRSLDCPRTGDTKGWALEQWVDWAGARLDRGCVLTTVRQLHEAVKAMLDCQAQRCVKRRHRQNAKQSYGKHVDCIARNCPSEVVQLHGAMRFACSSPTPACKRLASCGTGSRHVANEGASEIRCLQEFSSSTARRRTRRASQGVAGLVGPVYV